MIKITCPTCGRKIEAPDEAAGKQGKCPGCGVVFMILGKTEYGCGAPVQDAASIKGKEAKQLPMNKVAYVEAHIERLKTNVCEKCLSELSLPVPKKCPHCAEGLSSPQFDYKQEIITKVNLKQLDIDIEKQLEKFNKKGIFYILYFLCLLVWGISGMTEVMGTVIRKV